MAGNDSTRYDGNSRRRTTTGRPYGNSRGPSTGSRSAGSPTRSTRPSTSSQRRPRGARPADGYSRGSRPNARPQRKPQSKMGNSAPKRAPRKKNSSWKRNLSRGFSNVFSGLTQRPPLFIALVVVVVIAFGGLFDFAANNGKAYGGVTVNGVDVGGMTQEEIQSKLEDTFGKRLQSSQIILDGSVTASDAPSAEEAGAEKQENAAESEDVQNADDAELSDTETIYEEYGEEDEPLEWEANQITTGAKVSCDKAAETAVAIGRDEGGFLARFGLFFGPRDIPLDVEFDDVTLEGFLGKIDEAIGDVRSDATVVVEDGEAKPVEGHDGTMVDRDWIKGELSTRMLSEDQNKSRLHVTATDAPSRVTYEQAQQASDLVNKAIENGATFTYGTSSWDAYRADVGSWVTATTDGEAPNYGIKLGIDEDRAMEALIGNLDATVTADDIKITFEKEGDEIVVHTQGSTPIPDIPTAISDLEEQLFGEQGRAHTGSGTVTVAVQKSDAPEKLTFAQATDLGIVSELAEYTTEYSNEETAQNRNHNIHLVSDVLNNSIIEAGGGYWSFNETSGDTNLDPPYASAGSIVGGEYVDSIGGGICQVATTVFNAAYEAALDIPVRFNHSYYLANYPDGRDASVSYPELDLQISNQFESDVLLKVSYTDTSVTATIYGVATGYEVTTEPGAWEEGAKYKTAFERDDSLSPGMYYLKKYGSDGAKYSVTRTVKDAGGNLVSVKTFSSIYQAQDEVYVVGPDVDTSKLERDTDPVSSTSNASGYSTEDTTGLYWQDYMQQDDPYSLGGTADTDIYGYGTTDIYGTDTLYGDATGYTDAVGY